MKQDSTAGVNPELRSRAWSVHTHESSVCGHCNCHVQPGGGAIAHIGFYCLLFASAWNQCSHQYVRVTLVNKMSLNNYLSYEYAHFKANYRICFQHSYRCTYFMLDVGDGCHTWNTLN